MKSITALVLSVALITSTTHYARANDITSSDFNAADIKTLEISTPEDLQMSCGQLSTEAANMAQVIYATQDIKDKSTMKSHGITAAGAVGSFLVGSVTGGIGLAVGGFLMNYNVEERSDQADDLQYIAAQRRTLMMGIHNAKGCFGPIEHAMQNPEEFQPINKIALNTEDKYHAELRTRYNN